MNELKCGNKVIHYMKTDLFKAYTPLFTFMKLFGLYHKTESKSSEDETQDRCHLFNSWTFSRFYSISMLCFMGFNAMKLFALFDGKESFGFNLFIQIIYVAWWVKIALNVYACYSAFHDNNKIPAFFTEWYWLQVNHPPFTKDSHGKVLFIVLR